MKILFIATCKIAKKKIRNVEKAACYQSEYIHFHELQNTIGCKLCNLHLHIDVYMQSIYKRGRISVIFYLLSNTKISVYKYVYTFC